MESSGSLPHENPGPGSRVDGGAAGYGLGDYRGRESRFAGLPISDGIAVGEVCLFNERRHEDLPVYGVAQEAKERERQRLIDAVAVVVERIDVLTDEVAERVGPVEAEIFQAQKAILGDPGLKEQMLKVLDTTGANAEFAVSRTLDDYENRIQAVDNEYIKERATDIGEIRRRILDVLRNMSPALQCTGQKHCRRGRDRIIVAEELTPSLTVEMDVRHTIGFVTERGGSTSHAAILARALGVPAISGIEGIRSRVACGTELLLNGTTGEVVMWPGAQTLAQYPALGRGIATVPNAVAPVADLKVMANISLAAEVAEAAAMQAEGIGLYRTEFEFIAAGRMLDEDEQFERYHSVVTAMAGRPVTFRLLDIGGDKAAPFFGLPVEPNPYLGLRGSRLLLARPELFRAQVRALARVSAEGPVSVMYPMVVDRDQFLALKAVFLEATADLDAERILHGVMFEVPSACLRASEILEVADFGSVGTNDLVQYLFAADRNNELVAHDCDPDRPVFWSLISDIVRAAKKTGRPLSVCGEAAGDLALLAKFVDAGVQTVSVSARRVPDVRLAVG